MDYEDEMKISIKEIIKDLNSSIQDISKNITYYIEFINLKNKHGKNSFEEKDLLSALQIEKSTIEKIKKNIEDILYSNDIPEEYYKIEKES